MQLEKIFELVRKEEVVLWIGSGFSMYAGCPSGQQFAKIIYDALSNSEKEEINSSLSLMDLAEQFVRLKGGSRNILNTIIKRAFSTNPNSIKYHEILSNIPHIKTIITTNYDKLFENAYQGDIFPIISETDIAYRDKRTELFKVHGDVEHPNSIVITRTDYTDFFSNNARNNLIWTSVKERISNKTVVFIGYDLEDENIKLILNEIDKALGANRKEMFLIAPKFKQHKIQYLAQRSIQYVDFKGEPFIEKLYENIKDRIFADFDKRQVSVETFGDFSSKKNIALGLETYGDGFRIKSVKSKIPNSTGHISMEFKKDNGFLSTFQKVVQGESFRPIVLDSDALDKLRLVMNDVNIIGDDLENYRVVLKPRAAKEGTANVYFDNETEFEGLAYKLYRSKQLLELVISYKICDLIMQFPTTSLDSTEEALNVNFKIEINGNYETVNDAIQVHKLLLNIANGIGYTLYIDNSTKGYSTQSRNVVMPEEQIASSLYFFECLKKIEKHYRIRFTDLGNYSAEDFDNAERAVVAAEKSIHVQEWDGEMEFELADDEDALNQILSLNGSNSITAESSVEEEVIIYNQTINIGFQILEFRNIYATNESELRAKKTSLARVKSKTKEMGISYTPTLRENSPAV